jgi:hypothetical protein
MPALARRRAAARIPTATLRLPRLRADQYAIAVHPAKIKVVAMGRRWGKSTMGGAVVLAAAAAGQRWAWIVPQYKNARAIWRWIERTVAELRAVGAVAVSRASMAVHFPHGGLVIVYSADNPDAMRGESFNGVVLDEAARIPEEAWTDVIQPTLADYDGDAFLISTPKGKNWFWREYRRGIEGADGYASFHAPTAANPSPQIQKAAEMAKTRVSDRTYRQEWQAEFVEESGGVFRGVREAATAVPLEQPEPRRTYVMGVDWGQQEDYTVFTVLDAGSGRQVWLDRTRGISYMLQAKRLEDLARRFGVSAIVAEANAMGQPIVELLIERGLPVEPFVTTNATKRQIIDGLALALEQKRVTLIPDEVQLRELSEYTSERLPSGLIRYSAPTGEHDDTVMALALAWEAANTGLAAVSEEDAALLQSLQVYGR